MRVVAFPLQGFVERCVGSHANSHYQGIGWDGLPSSTRLGYACHTTGNSFWTPNTFRRTSQVSPSVAQASTHSIMAGNIILRDLNLETARSPADELRLPLFLKGGDPFSKVLRHETNILGVVFEIQLGREVADDPSVRCSLS